MSQEVSSLEPGRALVIVPTYNEAENLEPLVSAVLAQDVRLDVLVVDDHSPDGTGEIADRLAAQTSRVHVRHRPSKMGLGTAYIEGFKWSVEQGYDFVFEMDCDFSHDPKYLPQLLAAISDADLALGSRYIKGGQTPDWGLMRKLISRGGNTFARLVLGLKTHDCTGGFRCYRRETLERVPWSRIEIEGYGFQVGAVYCVERLGDKIIEIPIVFPDRQVGKSKMSSRIVVEAFLFVIRLAFSERFGQGMILPRSQVE